MNLLELVQINPRKHHREHAIVSSSASFIKVYKFNGGGGGTSWLPVMASMGTLRPKGVPFSSVQVHEGAGILQDEQANWAKSAEWVTYTNKNCLKETIRPLFQQNRFNDNGSHMTRGWSACCEDITSRPLRHFISFITTKYSKEVCVFVWYNSVCPFLA